MIDSPAQLLDKSGVRLQLLDHVFSELLIIKNTNRNVEMSADLKTGRFTTANCLNGVKEIIHDHIVNRTNW